MPPLQVKHFIFMMITLKITYFPHLLIGNHSPAPQNPSDDRWAS